MKRKAISLLLCSMLMITSLAGCSGTTNKSGASNKPVTITLGKSSAVASLDPMTAEDSFSCELVGNTYEGLYSIKPDGKPELALAKSVTISKDNLTYTFKIRDDAKWNNGDPVTANDFVYSWERNADPKNASNFSYQISIASIKNAEDVLSGKKPVTDLGVTAVDSKTLKIELTNPVPYLPYLLAFSPWAPLNQKFVEAQGNKFALTKDNVLYCGPYYVSDWEAGGNSITLKKNPKYFDADKVKVDTVKFQVIPDSQQSAMAYENGSVDFVTLTGDLVSKYKSNKDFHQDLSPYEAYLMVNTTKPGLNNLDLRQAIAYAIDKDQLTKNILKDGSVPAYSMVMKNLISDKKGVDFSKAAGIKIPTDVAKAKELWAKAKTETNLRTITLGYDQENEAVGNVAAYVQSQLETNLDGLKVQLVSIPKKTRIDNEKKGNYDIVIHRWGPDYADPTAILSMYQSNDVSNYSRAKNSEFDQLFKEAQTTYAGNAEKRWENLIKADNILVENSGCIPLYQSGDAYLMKSNIKDLVQHITGVPFEYKYVTVNGD